MSISPPTPNTTIIETSIVSTRNETAKTTPASQKRTRLSSSKIFDKDLCIRYLGPNENIKKRRKPIAILFYRLEQKKSWRHICSSTPFLKDQEMREKFLAMIALFPEDDPFAADIHYHKKMLG